MKKKLLIAIAWVLGIGLCLSLMPWGWDISVQTAAYEYALDREEPLAVHEVVIEGRYTFNVWGQDVFDGALQISGFPDTQEMPAKVQFWPDREFGIISYLDWAGQAHTKKPMFLYCSWDFEQFSITLAEMTQEDDMMSAHWDSDSGHVLCANASNYEQLKNYSEAVGLKLWEE